MFERVHVRAAPRRFAVAFLSFVFLAAGSLGSSLAPARQATTLRRGT